jgi:hypothetical protein
MAILTQALPGRSPCFYATPCGRGCSIKANFQSTTVLIPPAIETGNLDVIGNAMVREVTLDDQGRATVFISSIRRLAGRACGCAHGDPRGQCAGECPHPAQQQFRTFPQGPRQLHGSSRPLANR